MIGQLAANYPDTLYNQIPKGSFMFGSGGVGAWRSICGGPNGGMAVLTQVGAPTAVKDEYMAWYERFAFPSEAAYEDYASGEWTPGGTATGGWGSAGNQLLAPVKGTPQAVPKSLLCHASHGRWTEAAGGGEGAWVQNNFAGNLAQAGGDRCAKLVYDCVYKIAELINDWKAGTLPSGALDPAVGTCLTNGCHGGSTAYDPEIVECAPEVAGKMKCDESCHQ